jgi:hypothetical protein
MKTSVTLTVKLEIKTEDRIDPGEVLNDMEYDFTSMTTGATITEAEIVDWDIK